MNLPPGVLYRARNAVLVGKEPPVLKEAPVPNEGQLQKAVAVVQIQTDGYPDNMAYEVRGADDYRTGIVPYLRGDWEDFDRLFGFCAERRVSGNDRSPWFFGEAVHQPLAGGRTLPDISVIANFSVRETTGVPRPLTVFGCSMGYVFAAASPSGQERVERLYEFQSYGALLLDYRHGQVELWIAQAGDKVAVPSDCLATLYNLDDEDNPLVLLSISRTDHDAVAQKTARELPRTYGPLLLAAYDEQEAVFTINRLHVNSTRHNAGVRLPTELRERHEREIHIRRGARIKLGKLLYEELTQEPEHIAQFARLGIQIRRASPNAVLPRGLTTPALHFSRPLYDALERGSEVERHFRPAAAPLPDVRIKIQRRSRAHSDRGRSDEPRPLNRPLIIVVEGSGVWVEDTYRKLFYEKVAEGRRLSVFYADDTRWKAGRPVWAQRETQRELAEWTGPRTSWLRDWEIYLDKANPGHYARYLNLRPDVVFVVTPDFTHCAIAQQWIGKTPLIFVEKPFDSHIGNVDEFIRALGNQHERRTLVFGLDHFQFYAARIHTLRPQIEEHLGGAIASASFYLTEERPIEPQRVRTLQHGLTLDLLPHFIALLSYFGDIRTIDDIRVLEAGRYAPMDAAIAREFHSETYSKLRFTFFDESHSGRRVPCYAVVGKGFPKDVKLLELEGVNQNRVRIDLTKEPEPELRVDGYPYDSIMFLMKDDGAPPKDGVEVVTDPYFPSRTLRIAVPEPGDEEARKIMRSRYEMLLDDLLDQTQESIASALELEQGTFIVQVLDRIWSAIRSSTLIEKDREELTLDEPAARPGRASA